MQPLGLEGITLSGGEPMQQASEIESLLDWVHYYAPSLSVGMYTGYTRKELDEGRFQVFDGQEMKPGSIATWRGIQKHLDFAVMGRYNQLLTSSAQPLCGSSNQKIEFFSDRYTLKDFEPQFVEITILPGAAGTTLTGFPIGIHEQVTASLQGKQG
jgi:anaerobic ribonucleoside-triphosphate reductase activating protein